MPTSFDSWFKVTWQGQTLCFLGRCFYSDGIAAKESKSNHSPEGFVSLFYTVFTAFDVTQIAGPVWLVANGVDRGVLKNQQTLI